MRREAACDLSTKGFHDDSGAIRVLCMILSAQGRGNMCLVRVIKKHELNSLAHHTVLLGSPATLLAIFNVLSLHFVRRSIGTGRGRREAVRVKLVVVIKDQRALVDTTVFIAQKILIGIAHVEWPVLPVRRHTDSASQLSAQSSHADLVLGDECTFDSLLFGRRHGDEFFYLEQGENRARVCA